MDTRAPPPSGTLRPVIPVARNHPYLAASRPRAFAHRGWHVGELAGLENTLAAFLRARDEGYSYVETDVHATRDGVLVVHHDATLRRVAGHPGVLRAMDWADVDPVRVRGREKLPRLEEALEALPGMRFNVDLKSAGTLRPMLELLERDDVAERVAVACTEEGRLRAVRQRFGDRVVTGVSARAALSLRARSVLPGVLSRLVRVGGDLAQLPVRFGGLPVVDATSLPGGARDGRGDARLDGGPGLRDAPAARPRRRRDHDRPSGPAPRGAHRSRSVGERSPGGVTCPHHG